MANNSFIDANDLDFQTLKTSLKQYMQGQAIFQDYNFEGSNFNVLLDILAYNTVLNALYVNMAGSEMWLDSAQLRASIVSHAKELGYTPRSRTSAMVSIDVQATGNSLPDYINVPMGFQISGRDSAGDVFYFVTDAPMYLSAQNNWTAANTLFYEGRYITETFVVNSTSTFALQSSNIDTTSINVTVDSGNGVPTAWNYASDIKGVSNSAQIWFVQGYSNDQYELVFGDGVIGANLQIGDIVTVKYRETQGNTGNAFLTYSSMSGIAGATGVTISQTTPGISAVGGNDAEANDSIRFNATRYWQTQGTAISSTDYKSLLTSEFPQLIAVTAYGGEDAVPQKEYGTVFVAGKIAGSNVLPEALKQQMVDYLSSRIPLTITVSAVDADVYNLILRSNVTFKASKLTTAKSALKSAVSNTISQFDLTSLEQFDAPYYASRLASQINATDDSIVSNQTLATIYKSIPIQNLQQPQSFYFNNPLLADDDTACVWSSVFVYQSQDALLTDDGAGNINIAAANNTFNILTARVGSVDYDTGTVNLSAINIAGIATSTAYIDLFAQAATLDVMANNRQILSILPEDTFVTLTEIA